MAKSWQRIGDLHGSDAGRLAVKVFVCNGCGTHYPAVWPGQCRNVLCGRLDYTKFDSKGEAQRYAELRLREFAGLIRDLRVQVPFDLLTYDRGRDVIVKFGVYKADFVYPLIETGQQVIEDYKPSTGADRAAKLKLRCMEAMGFPVNIVTSRGVI